MLLSLSIFLKYCKVPSRPRMSFSVSIRDRYLTILPVFYNCIKNLTLFYLLLLCVCVCVHACTHTSTHCTTCVQTREQLCVCSVCSPSNIWILGVAVGGDSGSGSQVCILGVVVSWSSLCREHFYPPRHLALLDLTSFYIFSN